MDLAEAATKLTNTAWNLRGGVLEQAADGTPRIAPPSLDQLNTVISTYIPPLTLEERITKLEEK